jgi:hypothetical protein
MKDLSTISSDLFNKIRSRFSDIKIGDETGAVTNDESQARFFDVNYTVGDHELGRVNIKIDNDALTVIYNTDMLSDKALEAKDDWYKFLKDMRQFARSNLLTFDTRDITKSNLDQRDYEYLSKESGENKMSESRLFGTSKTSYQDVGEAKIIVKHSAPVNYNNPAGRTQRIESIYIESANGERFRYPNKHLNGARAMAVHVANGGAPYDAMGGYIAGLSEEIGKLRQFKNYTQRSGVVAEALGPISEQVAERLTQLKIEVAALQRQHYYEAFRENFKPRDAVEVPEETMSEWVDALTIKTFNEELTSVFPYIYRLVKEKADQGLTYDDIVAEAAMCEVCNEDPCACDDEKVEETNHLADFEQHLETLTTFDYDVAESDKGDMDQDGEDEPDDQEYLQNKDQAIKKASGNLSEEILEFIQSMYDANTGTFPRGEEGVKIACEKKFGESAGRFAQFAVERLSSKEMAEGPAVDAYARGDSPAIAHFADQLDKSTKEVGIGEGSAHGYNVTRFYRKYRDQSKITRWLKKEAGLPKETKLYFDDADLVLGSDTIVPYALVDENLKFNDLLTALVKATGGTAKQKVDGVYRDQGMDAPQESSELVRIRQLSGM